MRPWVMVGVLLCVARASANEDPDTEIARRHFQAGEALYQSQRYAEAIGEFEAARRAKPLPAFDFNIARCQDRLEHVEEAIAGYERYLASTPDDAPEVRARVDSLKRRRVTLAPPPARPRRWWMVPAAVGAPALALGLIGAGLLGSAAADFRSLHSSCAPSCNPERTSGLAGREHAGEALLAVAGAVAVADVVLWVIAARRGRTLPHAALPRIQF